MDTLKRFRWGVISLLLALSVTAIWYWWPSTYPQLSPKGYSYAMALYSICNRSDAQRLQQIEKMLGESVDQRELPAADARILLAIVRQAKNDNWSRATLRSQQLLEKQVEM